MSGLHLKWLGAEEWTIEQAALLLYGLDPEEWDGAVPKIEKPTNEAVILEYGLENLQTMLHHMRGFLYEVFSRQNYHDRVKALEVCQWAYITRRNFYFDGSLISFIASNEKAFLGGEQWIAVDYKQLSQKDLWSKAELFNVITFCPARLGDWHEGYFFAVNSDACSSQNFRLMYPENSVREHARYLFELSESAERFTDISASFLSNEKLYKPKELIDWAKEKDFQLPPKLLEYMGLGEESDNDNKRPASRASQLHKQLCQAIAKTLWDIQPDMTIEEMKNHPAIQEHGQGKSYTGKNTLRDWLSEVDPRPAERKRGAPKKK